MSHILIFPCLNLTFKINAVAFKVFGFEIYWYGIIIALATVIGFAYVVLRARTFNLDPDNLISTLIFTILGGIIGARVYYIIFNNKNIHSFFDVINIRGGGLAIYGGLILGFITTVISAMSNKIKILPLLDLLVGGVLIGQMIGRWGNFVNMEAFGFNTTLPWGMTSIPIQRVLNSLKVSGMDVDPSIPVHPCFLYESIWCLIGIIMVAVYTKRRKFDGELTLMYIAWYGFGRFFIEALRTDSLMCGIFKISQLLSSLLFVLGITILILKYVNIKNKRDLPLIMQNI